MPVPYCLDDCGFVVEPEVRQVDSFSSILLSQDCFGISKFFVSLGRFIPRYFILFIAMVNWIVSLTSLSDFSLFIRMKGISVYTVLMTVAL